MAPNEFEIDPDSIRPRRRAGRRPLPPGQTEHKYDDEPSRRRDYETDTDQTEPTRNRRAERTVNNDRRETRDSETRRTVRTARRANKTPEPRRNIFADARVRLFVGLTCVLLGFATFIVLISHLKNGALDQALILNMTPQQIADAGLTVKSGVGPVGAWFGHVLFTQALGVGSFVIAAYLFILGWGVLASKKLNFWSLTFKSLLLAVSLSIIIGLLTFALGSTTFYGGVHGHYVNAYLLKMTGVPGAILVSCLLGAAVVSVYLADIIRFYSAWRKRVAQVKALKILHKEHPIAEDDSTQPTENKAEANTEPTQADTEPTVTPAPQSTIAPVVEPTTDTPSQADVAFEIDTPAVDENPEKTEPAKDTAPVEPGFEIDVPVADMGKNTGTVAEKSEVEQGNYDPRADLSRFRFPSLDLLENRVLRDTVDVDEQEANKNRIIKTLGDYKITVSSIKATVGPTVTLFEIVPTEGIRIQQIKRLEDDIAMSLAAKGIRIIAPMPGKGTVGIEVPNRDPQIVSMRSILASRKFRESKANLPVALGATISNEIFVADLAAMPHALVAGATGQGKSVGLNAIITSLLYKKHPAELKFVLIDPKMVEFSVYERLSRHYLATLPGEEEAVVTDPAKVLGVLNSLCVEMDRRYALPRKASVVKIDDYNKKFVERRLNPNDGHEFLPYIVVVIDEFADLIMTGGKEIEMPVMRITQKARAVGIHMIIATQRPSTNVLTGLIKANCPTRVAFRVLQMVDSRTILDRPGAEHLIGRGDMLYSQGGDIERMQCAFITSAEVESICDNIADQVGYEGPYMLPDPALVADVPGISSGVGGGLDRDPLFDDAARFIVQSSTASTSSLQRRFEIGYNRAGKIMDQMEASGIVSAASGSKPRQVLVDPMTLERILSNK